MKTQQKHLEAILLREGWAIVERETPTADWWLDELWTLESTWSPVGERAFMSFLVDPQGPSERKPHEHVFAVFVTRERPLRGSHRHAMVFLRPRWERNRLEIVAQIRQLRSEASRDRLAQPAPRDDR